MRVVCEVCSSYHMEGGAVVNNDHDELKDVNGNEFSILIVGFE